MPDCPSYHFIGEGDYDESVDCALPLEHNADDEPWHVGVSDWTSDGVDVIVRWRWNKVDLVCQWPPLMDPHSRIWSAHYQQMLVTRIDGMRVLFDNIPVGEIPGTGTTVHWRKWGDLPKPSALETTPAGGETGTPELG